MVVFSIWVNHGSLLWVFWLYNPCLLKLWFAGLASCIGQPRMQGEMASAFFQLCRRFVFLRRHFSFLHLPIGKHFQLRRLSPTRKPSAEISAEGRSRYGPLQAISRVIAPLIGVITRFTTGMGPPCTTKWISSRRTHQIRVHLAALGGWTTAVVLGVSVWWNWSRL